MKVKSQQGLMLKCSSYTMFRTNKQSVMEEISRLGEKL